MSTITFFDRPASPDVPEMFVLRAEPEIAHQWENPVPSAHRGHGPHAASGFWRLRHGAFS